MAHSVQPRYEIATLGSRWGAMLFFVLMADLHASCQVNHMSLHFRKRTFGLL